MSRLLADALPSLTCRLDRSGLPPSPLQLPRRPRAVRGGDGTPARDEPPPGGVERGAAVDDFPRPHLQPLQLRGLLCRLQWRICPLWPAAGYSR